jgi:hypothetical protein
MSHPRPPLHLFLTAALVLALLLGLSGCSRIRLAYSSADLLLAGYADDYLGLEEDQRERWKPGLTGVLAHHRREELPYLASFFDRALAASQAGFPASDTACLVATARELYQRHARLAAALAAPLLADLEPAQVRALKTRFARDLAEDLAEEDNPERELRARAKRYVKAIEEWTGPLGAEQKRLIEEATGRMPDTREAIIAYRKGKRQALVGLLERGAGSGRLASFLTDWLAEYRDLPPDLREAGGRLEERLVELISTLGQSLTKAQKSHLERRLSTLKSDLLRLQDQPRLAPATC